jgi:uncharacterized protein
LSERPECAEENYARLVQYFSELDAVAVAFSGGVDSTILAKAAFDALGRDAVAFTARSEVHPEEEYGASVAIAAEIGIEQVTVTTNEMSDAAFCANPPDRCYQCKKELFGTIIEIAGARGISRVAEGSTLDDESDYRPGMKAIAELSILSPLKELGLGKSDVRAMLKTLGLPNWHKPAMACLATRIPYGSEITPEKLREVGEAEEFIRSLGIDVVRVRHHGSIARIEVGKDYFSALLDEQVRTKIEDRLKGLGFIYVALDLGGYRTGSMNDVLGEVHKNDE